MIERQMKIIGYTAVLKPWDLDPLEVRLNCRPNCEVINEVLKSCKRKGEPSLLVVTGAPGSGKTILAKVLESTRKNARYISESGEMSSLTAEITYIIDEPTLFKPSDFNESIGKHINAGGIAVVFVQELSDMSLETKFKVLELNRSGLLLYAA